MKGETIRAGTLQYAERKSKSFTISKFAGDEVAEPTKNQKKREKVALTKQNEEERGRTEKRRQTDADMEER